ncbi:MAG: Uma2 family endonuclease [Methylococcales bacterium]
MSQLRIEELPSYTYEDYVRWEGRWELIHGIPYAMSPAPSIQHQIISHKIDVALAKSLKGCEHCQALLPVDWKINNSTTVQPDNLVVCEKPEGQYLTKAPSIIFEILSKSTAKKDQNTKFRLYEEEGVKYYIIVDPKDQVAKVYQLQNGKFVKVLGATDENCNFDLGKCQVKFDFSTIWG